MPGASLTLEADVRPPSRSVSPGALSVGSFATSSHSVNPASVPRSPIPVSGTESAFFKSLLDFFYTACTPMGEVFTFLFEDSSYVDKEDAMDRLSQVNLPVSDPFTAHEVNMLYTCCRIFFSCGGANCSQTCR
jgi:hypothetical protein